MEVDETLVKEILDVRRKIGGISRSWTNGLELRALSRKYHTLMDKLEEEYKKHVDAEDEIPEGTESILDKIARL